MATNAAVAESNPISRAVRGTIEFYREVMAELKKVTWPDKTQVRQLSIGVIVIALFVGAVIAIIDVVLQQVLVRWIPMLFGS